MHISFTGHRDKVLSKDDIKKHIVEYMKTDNVWVHGGAIGFDTQINTLAIENNIRTLIIKPDYKFFGKYKAPLYRNRQIAYAGEILIACYDGRQKGGTYYTINFANKIARDIVIINPDTSEIEYIKYDRKYWTCDTGWACGILITVDNIIRDGAMIFNKFNGESIDKLMTFYKIEELKK